MTDLTKITTPFGLLDEETQRALKAHRGEIQVYTSGGWKTSNCTLWISAAVYRVKPEPPRPRPREWWVNVYRNGVGELHSTRERADNCGPTRIEVIHVREVLE